MNLMRRGYITRPISLRSNYFLLNQERSKFITFQMHGDTSMCREKIGKQKKMLQFAEGVEANIIPFADQNRDSPKSSISFERDIQF